MRNQESDISIRQALAVSILGVLTVGVVDYSTGIEVRIFPLYFLPIVFAAWFGNKMAAFFWSYPY